MKVRLPLLPLDQMSASVRQRLSGLFQTRVLAGSNPARATGLAAMPIAESGRVPHGCL